MQYIVTVSSSDDSRVYHNVTTSINNVLVTLNDAMFCVKILGVDAIGRGGVSQLQCFSE